MKQESGAALAKVASVHRKGELTWCEEEGLLLWWARSTLTMPVLILVLG